MSAVATHIEKPKTKASHASHHEGDTLFVEKPIWSDISLDLDQEFISRQEDFSNFDNNPFLVPKKNGESNAEFSSTGQTDADVSKVEMSKPKESPIAESVAPAVLPIGEVQEESSSTYPLSPLEDPAFASLINSTEQVVVRTTQHEDPTITAQNAQRAAPLASNELEGAAQSNQVETMAEQEPRDFDAIGFKAALMAKIEQMQLPENPQEATEFDRHNNLSEIQDGASTLVNQEQEQSAGPIAASSQAEPDLNAVVAREIEDIPEPHIGESPSSISADRAMPQPRPESQVSTPLQDNLNEVGHEMETHHINDEQLANANEPSFSNALSATESAREHSSSAPEQFRSSEQITLGATATSAEALSQQQLQAMHGDRQASFDELAQTQSQTGDHDSAERSRIAADIDAIYESTKSKVENILQALEEKVTQMFTSAATQAKLLFEKFVEVSMRDYRARRYSGVDGAARWVYDKFAGMPDEVNEFFVEGRDIYIKYLDKALDKIADTVANDLNLAKNTIQEGRNEVAQYVAELPENLQSIGTEAAESIQSQFDSLNETVNERQTELIDALAAQYMESLQEVDARIEEMQAENRGLIDMALDAIGEVVGVIIALKDMFLNLLSAIADVVQTIINDPIGFLRNLFGGIALGLENFGKNILTHLQAGLIGWLTGAMGGAGIQLPEDIFSLKGIFSLVSQILGFTWDRVRSIGVQVIGEPIMKALETGFEIIMILKNEGLAGLWEYIKEQFNDLKEMVIEGIKTMIRDTIISAGIKWLMGMLSPVGAFIKAAMAIIDVVTFFVQKATQIIELVSAFVESVRAVASGSISAVANTIENALARTVPLVIGFLANLLGIGGLANKVIAIINKLRERVGKAIKKLWVKIKDLGKRFLAKIGIGESKKEDGTKLDLRGVDEDFNAQDNKKHRLFFKPVGANFVLMIASTPQTFAEFISNRAIDETKVDQVKAKSEAVTIAQKIDTLKNQSTGGDKALEEKKKKDIDDELKNLGQYAGILFGINEDELPESNIIYGDMENEMGTKMEALILTKKGANGSEPTQSKHPIFDDLLLRRDGGRSYYIRGHLLNHNIHGPGEWKNMTPLSQEGNKTHLKEAEEIIKIAVLSGGIVYYEVIPDYKQSVPDVTDKQLDDANFISLEDKEKVRKIRNAEKHVPTTLKLKSHYLKMKGDKYEKAETLVESKPVINKVDLDLTKYKIDSKKKEKVSIKNNSKEEISQNTDIPVNYIDFIKKAADKIQNLTRYDQINQAIQNDENISSGDKGLLESYIEQLNNLTNVTLN
ncbi:hypothetical protein ACFOUP_07720 [Belliella kenyensis]|uniref:Uncharacterized protein n=1 Tax=Belliella kenyensis TaxID=1472724 RepID=A0ABV8EJ24_9BACT|nr:hypothetical protein [Belliella kenyensis]MCH7400362.1 hypothetical protein [Belliella kenyensis]MDN3604620.1 hypothetical protein [Belliella kenyensis]